MNKTVYYESFTDDVVESRNQHVHLPDGYEWVRDDVWSKVKYHLGYLLVIILAELYLRLVLKVHYRNRRLLWKYRKSGYFVYGNHTQPVGDPFIPVLACIGKRAFGIAGTANYGIPVLGKLMPWIGALPVVETREGRQKLSEAVERRIRERHVVFLYPEAHVWPYYTGIRPFSTSAFHYQQQLNVPGFTLTTVYRKRRFGKKPRIEVIVNGPFRPDSTLSPRDQRQRLRDEVFQSLKENATLSNCDFIQYICTTK